MKDLIKGGIITLLIGGSAYTISQSDVIKNFADDTGLTQEQAEEYVNNISEDELFSFDKIGADLIDEGKEIDSLTPEIDCVNYEYEWESARLSCQEGKAQLGILARDYISLGEAYIKLSSDSASEADMSETIRLIDRLNSDFQLEMVSAILDLATIDEIRKTNSYNKAILKAALESDN